MKRYLFCLGFVSVLLLVLPAASRAADAPDQQLPERGQNAPLTKIMGEDQTVKSATRAIAEVTKWHIFCTSEAGNMRFTVYAQDAMAGDMLKNIVRSQGLAYRVEGNAIYIMTPEQYNEIYGAAKEVIQLMHAPAEKIKMALEPLLATAKKGGRITALPEASAVVVYDSLANLAVLREVAAKLDRPLETVVVPLKEALAAEVAVVLTGFLSPMGRVSADRQSNQVVISDIPGKAESLKKIALAMDLPSTRETRRFALKHAECAMVAQYLADMFGLKASAAQEPVVRPAGPEPQPQPPPGQPAGQPGGQPAGQPGGERRRRSSRAPQPAQPSQPRPSAQASRGAMRRAVALALEQASSAAVGTVVPDVRTNSVWVTDTPDRILQIAEVVKDLDTALETKVHQLSYADPEQLAAKLAAILMSPFDHYDVDLRTRRVSITTTPEKMSRALALLEEWDAEPRQVFITGKILAVNRDRMRDIGVSYDALVHQMDENVGIEIQPTGAFLPVIPATPKGSIRFGNLILDNFSVLIEMLESDSTTRLLSSPRVMALDGVQAIFLGTTEEPYTEIQIQGDTQTTVENVEFKNVGVTLQVTPTIGAHDRITMDILMEVSSLQEIRAGIPVVSRSQMVTTVVAANGRPLVMGGLITDQDVETVDKVPLLGDIPLFGWLFRNTRRDRSQRELVLIIVPTIVGAEPYAAEPTLSLLEQDLRAAPYLAGEEGEGTSPAGAGVPYKGGKDRDEIEEE